MNNLERYRGLGIACLLISLPLLLILGHAKQTLQQNAQEIAVSPFPTCIPRPACLDANPRCEIMEPSQGWCRINPNPTPPPNCHYIPVVCPQFCIAGRPCAPCSPKLVCTTPIPTSSVPTPTPTPPSGCFYKTDYKHCPLIACQNGKNCSCPPVLVCQSTVPVVTAIPQDTGNVWSNIKIQWMKMFNKQ